MSSPVRIVAFDPEKDRFQVAKLWANVFGYETAHNEPDLVLKKKEEVGDGLLFVAKTSSDGVVGTVMCGYDGHRGWIYSLSVSPEFRNSGIGTALMTHAERALQDLGCMKINLQIMESNGKVQTFYENLGYATEKRISMGKQIESNIPTLQSRHRE